MSMYNKIIGVIDEDIKYGSFRSGNQGNQEIIMLRCMNNLREKTFISGVHKI